MSDSSVSTLGELEDALAKAQQGDMRHYRRAFDLMIPPVRRYAHKTLARYGQAALAEDTVQETMLAVHLKLHTYRTGEPAMPWIYTIARYKMIDMLRRLKIRDVSIDAPGYEDAGASADSVAETEVRTDLNNLLDRLEPPQGEMIRALKVEGASVADLAQTYGYSESNVKVIIHRGLKKLNALVIEDDREQKA